MLDKVGFHDATAHSQPDTLDDTIDLDQLLAAVRRQMLVVIGFTVLAVAIGVAYLALATREYTSSSQVLIDMNNANLADKLLTLRAGGGSDEAVASQIQLIESQRLAERVAEKESLITDAEFMVDTGYDAITEEEKTKKTAAAATG